tara:strand:- start:295 stop:816 length:522 start_codon:yes stop_codon:yes gene_type:complete
MKYILDFDRTLFDVEGLYLALEEKEQRHLAGTTESLLLLDPADFLFPDVIDFLKKHKKEDLFILSSSQGITADWTEDYQAEKIERTGLSEYVAEVIVMKGGKGEFVRDLVADFPEDNFAFIDDQAEQCISVKNMSPEVECFVVKRDDENRELDETVDGFRIIKSLFDLSKLLQ